MDKLKNNEKILTVVRDVTKFYDLFERMGKHSVAQTTLDCDNEDQKLIACGYSLASRDHIQSPRGIIQITTWIDKTED